ncbi:MAG: GAF and ANTAR domain-containing protein [Acidobacteria bacterium]|nr:GAF and ANTAR domain-containing protein [Acidobacteriota bacterium]
MPRETVIINTLVELADNLVDHFDVIDLLTLLSDRCVEALDVDAAGVLLASPGAELQFVASSSESMRVLELFQIQMNEGPCVDCYLSGAPVVNVALDEANGRWPLFTPRALEHGFNSVHSLPLRLRGRTIGALNLFRTLQGPMGDDDIIAAQGLAHVATIAILQHRATLDANTLNEQLENALTSRIIIEQAKGIIAQSTQCGMDQAFGRLRAHSRNHNQGLTGIASAIVAGTLSANDLENPN